MEVPGSMSLRRSVLVLLVFLGSWGCDNSLLPPPAVTPDLEQAEAFGSTIDNHTQDLLLAFNIQEFLLFELPLKALPGSDAVPSPRIASCPLLDNDLDADGDGIPDDVTFSFTGNDCTIYVDPVGTFTQSGTIHIVDRGEAPGYQLTFDQYRVHRTTLGSLDTATITVDGTWDVTATTTTATLLESVVVTTDETIGGTVVASRATYDWKAVFTADGMNEVDLSIPLPTGILAVSGDTTWQQGKTSFSYRISTPQLLAYDSTCRQGPEFLTGRIQAAQVNAEGAFVHLRYTGCAVDPIIQRMSGR